MLVVDCLINPEKVTCCEHPHIPTINGYCYACFPEITIKPSQLSLPWYKGEKQEWSIIYIRSYRVKWLLPEINTLPASEHIFYVCSEHGVTNNKICNVCLSLEKQQKFIEKSNTIHSYKYTYPEDINYRASNYKTPIICPEHGVFLQRPHHHLAGKGCPKCVGNGLTLEERSIKYNKIHNNKYEYLELFYTPKQRLKIKCPEHGIFEQYAHHHTSGKGCPKCGDERQCSTFEEWKDKCNKIHNNFYTYIKPLTFRAKYKQTIICPKHGKFNQYGHSHAAGYGCSKCKRSKGEVKIESVLTKNNITFISQKSFDGCKHKDLLYFDFFIDGVGCIEFQGRQHYEPIPYFGGDETFKEQIKRDEIKREFCSTNNIPLLEIRYDDEEWEKHLLGFITPKPKTNPI